MKELVSQFIHDGFIRVDQAFSKDLAAECRAILWRDIPGSNQPVLRLGGYSQEPFVKAANTPVLHEFFDQLVGKGRWVPRDGLGGFVVRFPSDQDPGDTGWHIDASFPDESEDPSYTTWRSNIFSRDRALLMLFLFSDIGPDDAPTRIRVGSHLDVARVLEPAGKRGMGFFELARELDVTAHRPEALATGEAGTVYLCHPFLVHAGQPHRGKEPRFLGQPPLYPMTPFQLERADGDYSPVEVAIRMGLGKATDGFA